MLPWILPGGIALLLFAVLPHFPGVTEWIFARGLFRIITVPVGFLTSLLPFSLTELLVIAAVPLAVWLIVHMVRKYRRCAARGALIRSLLRKTAWVLTSEASCYASIFYGYDSFVFLGYFVKNFFVNGFDKNQDRKSTRLNSSHRT